MARRGPAHPKAATDRPTDQFAVQKLGSRFYQRFDVFFRQHQQHFLPF